jgi:hypothetical protein
MRCLPSPCARKVTRLQISLSPGLSGSVWHMSVMSPWGLRWLVCVEVLGAALPRAPLQGATELVLLHFPACSYPLNCHHTLLLSLQASSHLLACSIHMLEVQNRAADVAQWHSTCVTGLWPWLWASALQKKSLKIKWTDVHFTDIFMFVHLLIFKDIS